MEASGTGSSLDVRPPRNPRRARRLSILTSSEDPVRAALPAGAPKLLFLIVAAGVVASSLLVTRQQRVETAHELTTLHRRLTKNERALWELRAAIAERCRPEAVRRMLESRPAEWTTIPRGGPGVPEIPPPPAPGSVALSAPGAPTPEPPTREPGSGG